MTKKNIAIIGAGYAGLSAAWDLAKQGHHITVYEAAENAGGLAGGFTQPNWNSSVEFFYHHIFETDTHFKELLNELELSQKMIFPRPYSVVYHDGKFYPFDSILQALLFPGLGYGITKVRFGLVTLFLRLTKNWQPLEKVTVDQWMRKWAGNKAYEIMWKPMMDGKFGSYAEQVNMAWMWARLRFRTTRLGTYQGGFQQFANDFVDKLIEQKVTFQFNTKITNITTSNQQLTLTTSQGSTHTYDQILATIPPRLLPKVVPQLNPDYQAKLNNLKQMGALVLVLSLKHKLSTEGYYWFNMPKSAGYPFLSLVEHTNYVSEENFDGEHIIYCGDYLEGDNPLMSMSKEEILTNYLPGIQRINPEFSEAWINNTWLFKTNYAQPIPFTNHSQNIPPIETGIAGLYYASMSQVYPNDRGTNYAIELGRRAAKIMQNAQQPKH